MNINDLKSKNTYSFICRYKLLKDIDLKYKINTKVFLTSSFNKFILSFDSYIESSLSSLEYRHRKFSYLRKLKPDISNDNDLIYADLIELYFDRDSETFSLQNILNSKEYIAYIENYDDTFLYLVIYKYDRIRIDNLNFYCANGKIDIYNRDFIYTYDSSGLSYALIANNSNKYYLVGDNKYLELNYQDNVLSILDYKNTVSILDKNNYFFTLYFGKHNFYNNNSNKYTNKIQTSDINTYLNMWEKYEDASIELVMNSFKNAKYLEYSSFDVKKDYVDFKLKNNGNLYDFIENTSNINVSSLFVSNNNIYDIILTSLQEIKKKNNMNNIEELKFISQKFKDINKNGGIFSFEYTKKLRSNDDRLFLDKTDNNFNIKSFNDTGYIFYFPQGEYILHERRILALNNITNNKAAMPNLNKILSQDKSYIASKRKKRILPITEATAKKVFKHLPPTENQKKAIEIALNTPDIAMIQGPPGTGKTTVITAILNRLSEESGSNKRYFANDLVSAYQHDAVSNCIERLSNFELPAVEIGAKNSLTFLDSITNWMNNKTKEFREKYPNIVLRNEIKNIDDKIVTLLSMRNIQVDLALNFCDELLNKTELSLELKEQIITFKNRQLFLKEKTNIKEDMINLLYKIPTTLESYTDDGFNILSNIIFRFKTNPNLLEDETIKKILPILDNFIKNPNDFNTLSKVKRVLLLKFLQKSHIFLNKNNKETEVFIDILNKALEEIRWNLENNKDSIDDVLSSYYHSLNNDKYYIIDSIKNYCFTVGATNQKSDSELVWKNKIKDYSENSNKYYDNILLDEAARSNPLDIIIPMSLAKNRIIIVGDHRQLPHMTEEIVLKKLEKDENLTENDIQEIKTKSMFEYLFEYLKILEKRDNIKRTITLDNQYRTHPILGNFISKNFYENTSKIKINSPLPASKFVHNLPDLDNKPCMWIDVANVKETKIITGGYTRKAEAEVIAKHIKKLLDSDAGSKLTFGVITFYKKQVECLQNVFNDNGIFNYVSGNYEVDDKYKNNIVLVGSVDAFQGREFDVVYLSTVRSNFDSKRNFRSYGFLKLESRLCVSMSRQKKLLISVGDISMFDNDIAKISVPGIYNFVQLCKIDGVIKNGTEI